MVDPSFISLLLDALDGPNPAPANLEGACLQMLSHPMPFSYATPASTHMFLSRLTKKAVARPSVATLQPFYSVITVVGTECVNSMSQDLTNDLHQTITRTLRSTTDHTVSLLCLAILARLCPGLLPQHSEVMFSKEADKEQSNIVAYVQNRPLQVRSVFAGKRACNALELAILQAIIACSENPQGTVLTSHEVLALAVVVVKAMGAEDRHGWIKRSTPIVQKYHDRIFRRELDEALRCQGIELWTALTEGYQLNTSDEDVMTIETMISKCHQVTQLNCAVIAYCGRFSTSFIKAQLVRALEAAVCAKSPCSLKSTMEVNGATRIIESFVEAIKLKNKLRKTVLIALTASDLRVLLQNFLAPTLQNRSRDSHQDTDVCAAQASTAIQILQKRLCVLFLLSSLHSTFDDIGIDPTLASNILEKVQEASIPPPKCGMFQSCHRSSAKALSLVQISGTPTSQGGNWRDRLASELSREASLAQSRTIRFIHDVCRDLEERCNEVEHPLRKEQARSMELGNENERLQEEIARLAREAVERTSAMDTMGARELDLSECLRDREASLTALRTELQHARRAESDAIELTKEMSRAQDMLNTEVLKRQAAVASIEVLLKDQAACFSSLELSFDALKEKASSLEKELSKSNETHLLLLGQRNSEMEQARKASSKQAREMDKLRHAEKKKIYELENLQRQVCMSPLLSEYDTDLP